MTTYNVRINGIYDELTAKERALLVLRSWKAGKEEDPAWRVRMPPEQTAEFNRYIGLMNGVNRGLGLLLMALVLEAEKLSLRLGWLTESALWAMASATLRDYVVAETKEPITESEYRKKAEAAAAEYTPVADCAEVLAYRYTDWAEEDAESWDERDGLIIKDEAWARLCREKERALAKLVADGTLRGKGRGARLRINNGSFAAWLGGDAPALPSRGLMFDVVPDDQAEDVETRRRLRGYAFEELDRAPSINAVFDPSYWPEELRKRLAWLPAGEVDEAVQVNKDALREGIERKWRELRAVEAVVAEAEEVFAEDPCVPQVRHMLDHARERLADAHETAQWYLGPFELPEPSEDEVEEMRAIAGRAG